MITVYSTWLAAHGKLCYDDRWYRLAWIAWPQAFAAVVVLWFWTMPSNGKSAHWASPIDIAARASQLTALRDAAKSSRPAMDTLELDALGGEMLAQFLLATLYDPEFKLSTIVQPDIVKAVEWYSKAANQGDESSMNNLAPRVRRYGLPTSGRICNAGSRKRDFTRARSTVAPIPPRSMLHTRAVTNS